LFPPFFPAVLATAYYLCDQPQEAADAARSALALAPESLDTQVMLAAALAAAGRADEAGEAAKEVLRIKKSFSIGEFSRSQPYQDPSTLERLAVDLASAGLS
jgi:tetratricopeptide (TPR) repeat protein